MLRNFYSKMATFEGVCMTLTRENSYFEISSNAYWSAPMLFAYSVLVSAVDILFASKICMKKIESFFKSRYYLDMLPLPILYRCLQWIFYLQQKFPWKKNESTWQRVSYYLE